MSEMTCAVARELMLEADPAELAREIDTPLSRHVALCAACAADARAVLGAHTELARALTALAGAHAAAARAPSHAREQVPQNARAARLRHLRRRWLVATAPLAAAAVLVLALFGPRLWQRAEPFDPIMLPVEAATRVAVVNAPADRDVAVLQPTNPNITIIWQLARAEMR